jgi:magnesium-transporting ATPase (P-type)
LVEERIEKIPRVQSQLEFTKQLGTNWAVVHGRILADMTQEEWDEILAKPYIVFARTTPNETLLIVEACQTRNEIVALFAGSVSDSPALGEFLNFCRYSKLNV